MAFQNSKDWMYGPESWGFQDMFGVNKQQPAPMPQAPATETAGETIAKAQATTQAALQEKKKRAARSRSIYTSPLGLAEEAQTIKKILLGQ